MQLRNYLITFSAALFIVSGTFFAISWAKGYRPDIKNGKLKPTGLLVANSFPTGAQVYVDGKLVTATDDTLNLKPGNYHLKISKDGFIPWEKELKLEKELVAQTNALLFPLAPDLQALTFTGALNPNPSPDGEKMAFRIASASAQPKNGLYILRMSNDRLSFKAETQQLASNISFDFAKGNLLWSPDSDQILAYQTDKNNNIIYSVLLETNKLNPEPLVNQNPNLSLILADWEEQVQIITKHELERLPDEFLKILQTSAINPYWSPDKEKILYTATASAVIAENLIPSLPASNNQPENRKIEPDKTYVYDLKEDRNFQVFENATIEIHEDEIPQTSRLKRILNLRNQYSPIYTQKIQWFPNSTNLIMSEPNKIISKEYDNTNEVTIYARPMKNLINGNAFVFPWPDASKLIIMTSLNKDLPANLYAIKLK